LSSDRIFVAARNNIDAFDYLNQRKNEDGVILVYTYDLRLTEVLQYPFALRDMHQIVYFDNKLWVTCSYENMVAVYNFSEWTRWYPAENKEHRGSDINHFNSLWADESSLYVVTHNNGPSEVWRFSILL
jgi:hypothetical protein